MPANIEIKARVHDFAGLQERAEQLSDTPCQVIPQEDTFFNCPQGRIKLRELSPQRGQLVYYMRQDITGPKHSEYKIFETNDPAKLETDIGRGFWCTRGDFQSAVFIPGRANTHPPGRC